MKAADVKYTSNLCVACEIAELERSKAEEENFSKVKETSSKRLKWLRNVNC